MTPAIFDRPCSHATDGAIAAINLQSARHRAWERFTRDPRREGAAEAVVDHERLAAQFLGDLPALDRLVELDRQFARAEDSHRAALVHAEVASTLHRFDEARRELERARRMGGPPEAIERLSLTIDQACGTRLGAVVEARYQKAAESGNVEDLVPLGAVLADLGRIDEADAAYRLAYRTHRGASPFPLAWTCFQLGMLWGEMVPSPDTDRAALWYGLAIAYVPGYVKARVHLAEIHASQGDHAGAEALLVPVLSSGDPEVHWRLGDVLLAQERFVEGAAELRAARAGFESLIEPYPLAFADHAAEFYAGSGNDLRRALELARANAANRPTRRAVEQVQNIAAHFNQ